jgi:hypothetical protein
MQGNPAVKPSGQGTTQRTASNSSPFPLLSPFLLHPTRPHRPLQCAHFAAFHRLPSRPSRVVEQRPSRAYIGQFTPDGNIFIGGFCVVYLQVGVLGACVGQFSLDRNIFIGGMHTRSQDGTLLCSSHVANPTPSPSPPCPPNMHFPWPAFLLHRPPAWLLQRPSSMIARSACTTCTLGSS